MTEIPKTETCKFILCLLWDSDRDLYMFVKQNLKNFHTNIIHVLPYRGNRIIDKRQIKTKESNNHKRVLLNREFELSNKPYVGWSDFRRHYPQLMFGLRFYNIRFGSFSILTEDELREKFNHIKSINEKIYTRIKEDATILSGDYYDGVDIRSRHCMVKHSVRLYRKLNLIDDDDCVKCCLVRDVWTIYDAAKKYYAS